MKEQPWRKKAKSVWFADKKEWEAVSQWALNEMRTGMLTIATDSEQIAGDLGKLLNERIEAKPEYSFFLPFFR